MIKRDQEKTYPCLQKNIKFLTENSHEVVNRCNEQGIEVAGVVKGVCGDLRCAEAMLAGGVKQIASSRIEQIIGFKNAGIDSDTLLLRTPMRTEIPDVIKHVDISLNSEIEVLCELNSEAEKQGKVHNVILMKDVGDLREGFFDDYEIIEACKLVENKLNSLHLYGIGTNVGCYGSLLPTHGKLQELVEIVEKIESIIGRRLQCISGGATSSYMRVLDGDMPERINHLRIGENILLAFDLPHLYGYEQPSMHKDAFVLLGEVIEVKDKPSKPVGETAFDAFGRKKVYPDFGVRKRAIVAMGRCDIGDFTNVFPKIEGVKAIGDSSDHLILDIEESQEIIKVGDILSFDVNYGGLMYASSSQSVSSEYI